MTAPLRPTELRHRTAPTSEPLPDWALKTFEAYLPYVLGVTEPEHAPLVREATERFGAYVQAIPAHERGRDDLWTLLMWTRVHGTFFGGLPVAPWQQSPARRERFIRRFYGSDRTAADWVFDKIVSKLPLPQSPTIRDLAKSLREMMGLAFYTNPNADPITGYTRVWDRTYPDHPDVDLGRLRATRQPATFDPREVASVHMQGHPYEVPRLFAYDGRPRVAVIGSGAGGAVTAARLAQTGKYDVAVFESGPRLNPGRYPLDTLVGMSQLFESGLLTLSKNLDIHLLRGRLVGGGTVLTSGLSVEPRAETKDLWCATNGPLSIGVKRDAFDLGIQKVFKRQALGKIDPRVYTDASDLLGVGARKIGDTEPWAFDRDVQWNNVMMRRDQRPEPTRDQNGDSCFGCGLCNYGCHFGHKLSMDLTYILDAERAGARIHQNLPIERLEGHLEEGGMRVTHLVFGRGLDERVEVDHVVLSAGAVGSPAVLLRSEAHDGSWGRLPAFQNDHVGTGLGFNYGSGVVARWQNESARPGHMGFQIKFVATKGGDPDFEIPIPGKPAHRARYVLENAFVPPGLMSNVVPGVGAGHRDWMTDYKKLAMCASTIGSPQTGVIRGDRTVEYKLNQAEMDLNRDALAGIARLYFAAGASEVGLGGIRQPPEGGASETDTGQGLRLRAETHGDLTQAELAAALEPVVFEPEHIMLSSAHPQGGLRMSAHLDAGAVGPDFRLRGAHNLHVVDASLFPSTIVVNPQWTIAALAEVASEAIAQQLG